MSSGSQRAAGPTPSTRRITSNLLLVALLNGAAGAPLVGALREQVQETLGLSRWALGAGVAAVGVAAGAVGLILTSCLPRVGRLTFIRAGLAIALAGFGSYVFVPGRASAAVAVLAAGWFVLTLGRGLTIVSNAVFTDLWQHAPHTGVILLHAVNSIGKLLAPLLALVLTAALAPNAIVYTGILAVLTLDALTWPRAAVAELTRTEQTQRSARGGAGSALRRPLFWLVCLEFIFIAGSEAGVASILPAFIEHHRPPLAGLSPRGWSQVVLGVMIGGIVAGRFAGFLASRRLGEGPIIFACLACVLAVFPAAASTRPAVYLPSVFLLGIAFSATWPANFARAARRFPHDKTVLSMGAALGTLTGVNGFVLLASLIGNKVEHLPLAVVISAAGMYLFAISLIAARPPRPNRH